MEIKKCCSCKLQKNLSNFSKSSKNKDGLQDVCIICMKTYRKQHYLDHKDEYKERTNRARERRTKEREEFKGTQKCKICGESRWWVLDFHHRDPSTKEFSIGHLSTRSMKKMKVEMDKCDILCSNCHRDLHHQERIRG